MELKEFIKQSLIEICEGVKEAQTHMFENKIPAYINSPNGFQDTSEKVEFDVAVTVSSNDRNDISGKLTIAGIFKAGAGTQSNIENSSVSRIKFAVPVRYTPYHP